MIRGYPVGTGMACNDAIMDVSVAESIVHGNVYDTIQNQRVFEAPTTTCSRVYEGSYKYSMNSITLAIWRIQFLRYSCCQIASLTRRSNYQRVSSKQPYDSRCYCRVRVEPLYSGRRFILFELPKWAKIGRRSSRASPHTKLKPCLTSSPETLRSLSNLPSLIGKDSPVFGLNYIARSPSCGTSTVEQSRRNILSRTWQMGQGMKYIQDVDESLFL